MTATLATTRNHCERNVTRKCIRRKRRPEATNHRCFRCMTHTHKCRLSVEHYTFSLKKSDSSINFQCVLLALFAYLFPPLRNLQCNDIQGSY